MPHNLAKSSLGLLTRPLSLCPLYKLTTRMSLLCNAQVRLSSHLHVLSREQADEDMCRQCAVNELLAYHLF